MYKDHKCSNYFVTIKKSFNYKQVICKKCGAEFFLIYAKENIDCNYVDDSKYEYHDVYDIENKEYVKIRKEKSAW